MGVVEVLRGGLLESRHAVDVAVTDADGVLVASTGDVDGLTFLRSAAKPLQALPLVEEAIVERFALTQEELALCCASHEGEPEHIRGVRSILAKAGVGEELLACGPHLPFSASASAAVVAGGGGAQRIHNNCSGKHAGMLALAAGMGWSPRDYHAADHPVQRRMMQEMERWTGLREQDIPTAVDGCGVVCFAVGLRVMATAFARFSSAARSREPAATVVSAMTKNPFMVGGTGRTCTDVMRQADGSVFVKVGAEGVYAAGIPAEGLGIAIKVLDGGRRAVEVALVQVLTDLGVFGPSELSKLTAHANPIVHNTRGEIVGQVRSRFALSRASG